MNDRARLALDSQVLGEFDSLDDAEAAAADHARRDGMMIAKIKYSTYGCSMETDGPEPRVYSATIIRE